MVTVALPRQFATHRLATRCGGLLHHVPRAASDVGYLVSRNCGEVATLSVDKALAPRRFLRGVKHRFRDTGNALTRLTDDLTRGLA